MELNRQRRFDESPDPVFAARDAGDHHVLHDERRARDAVAGVRVGHRDVPEHGAGFRAQRHQMCVHGAEEHAVAQHGHAAIDGIAADIDLRRQRAFVMPERPARRRIEREHVRRRLAHVHHAVHHDRRGFNPVAGGHLVDPRDFQIGHVLPGDLVERAVAPAIVSAGIIEPVLRLGGGLQQAVVRDLGIQRRRGHEQKERKERLHFWDLCTGRCRDAR